MPWFGALRGMARVGGVFIYGLRPAADPGQVLQQAEVCLFDVDVVVSSWGCVQWAVVGSKGACRGLPWVPRDQILLTP